MAINVSATQSKRGSTPSKPKPKLRPGYNERDHFWYFDEESNRGTWVPVPFMCDKCIEPSRYGVDNHWLCTDHYLEYYDNTTTDQ
jgi:hypothetical protein